MKQFFKFLIIIFVFSFIFSYTSLAVESGEESTEKFITDEDPNGTYIANNEDLDNLIADTATGDYSNLIDETQTEEQIKLKEYYEEQAKEVEKSYEEYELIPPVLAKVTEVTEPYEFYNINSYYQVSRYYAQKIKVLILDGEYKDKEIETRYYLSDDSLLNSIHTTLDVGDKIWVRVAEDGEDFQIQIYALDRLVPTICIIVVAFILLIIFFGKKGFVGALACVATFIVSVVLFPQFGLSGNGFILTGIFGISALILMISFMYFGLSRRTLQAIAISIISLVVALLTIVGCSAVTRTTGITLQATYVSGQIYVGSFNFTEFYYMTSLFLMVGVITNIICQSITKIDASGANDFETKIEVCKNLLVSNVSVAVVILAAIYIPNYIPIITNKLSLVEMLNEETFIVELVRMISIIISSAIAVAICSLNCWRFGQKTLGKAK